MYCFKLCCVLEILSCFVAAAWSGGGVALRLNQATATDNRHALATNRHLCCIVDDVRVTEHANRSEQLAIMPVNHRLRTLG